MKASLLLLVVVPSLVVLLSHEPAAAAAGSEQEPARVAAARAIPGLPEGREFDAVLSRSFQAIVSPDARKTYGALAHEDRAEYRARYWRQMDPTPATDRNEFLEEHLRRLQYTLANFCPEKPLDWDARGDVMLRFGPPNARVLFAGDIFPDAGIIAPAETWTYEGMKLSVRFVDPNLDGRYDIGDEIKLRTPSAPGASAELDPIEPPPGGERPRDVGVGFEDMRLREFEQAGRRALADVPVAYTYVFPSKPIVMYYDLVTARGEEDKTDLAVSFQMPMSSVSFEGEGDRYTGTYVKRLRVLSTDYRLLAEEARESTLTSDSRRATLGDALITDEWRLDVTPGEYIVEISVEDAGSDRTGMARSRVIAPDYASPGLHMSDIQIATSIGEGRRFSRMGGAVVPYPKRVFRTGDDVVIYFELYGLTGDSEGRSQFEMTTEILAHGYEEDLSPFRRFLASLLPALLPAVSTQVSATDTAPDAFRAFTLSLAELKPDIYDLTIAVAEAESGERVSQTVTFTVSRQKP